MCASWPSVISSRASDALTRRPRAPPDKAAAKRKTPAADFGNSDEVTS
jgi:hypothetical protein